MALRLTRASLFAAAVCLVGALAGCGGNKTARQTLESTSSASNVPSVSAATFSTAEPVPSSVPSLVAAPSVSPAAQGAVDAYIALTNFYNAASRNPATTDLDQLNVYLTGKALSMFDQSIASMKSAGQAYRGSPGSPRVKVQSILSPTSVFLTSCPVDNSQDPFVEYYVANGLPVPIASRNPPPPYLLTLPMQLIGTQWKLGDILQDVSKTCT